MLGRSGFGAGAGVGAGRSGAARPGVGASPAGGDAAGPGALRKLENRGVACAGPGACDETAAAGACTYTEDTKPACPAAYTSIVLWPCRLTE